MKFKVGTHIKLQTIPRVSLTWKIVILITTNLKNKANYEKKRSRGTGALLEGAIDKIEKCDDEELTSRIEQMKEYVFHSHSQEETGSTN